MQSMAKGQSPLLGYNTNVRHRGRIFHIQTEDSGVQHPHVITHLFADGGRIIKSTKTSYADLLELPDWQERVKKIMQEQHKAMFIALRDGQYDALIDPSWATEPKNAPATAPAPAPTQRMSTSSMSAQRPSSVGSATSATSEGATAATAAVRSSVTGSTHSSGPAAVGSTGVSAEASNTATTTTADRVETGVTAPSSLQASRSGRYASVRSPEVFGSFKNKPQGPTSIFGDALISEKSLDEVILAYLAEELDESKS